LFRQLTSAHTSLSQRLAAPKQPSADHGTEAFEIVTKTSNRPLNHLQTFGPR